MLVLSRKVGEIIRIGDDVIVKVISMDRGLVRIGISAPTDIPVHRGEVYDRIQAENRAAVESKPEHLAIMARMWKSQAGQSAAGEGGPA